MVKREAALIPRDRFAQFEWWGKLDVRTQTTVEDKTQELARALMMQGSSKLATGKVLAEIRDILEPQRLFLKYIREGFHMSQRTAYRYIVGYENTAKRLPSQVLERAMARGFNMIGDTPEKPLGIYTDIVKKLPVPKTEAKADAWLDDVEEARRKIRSRLARRAATEDEDMVDPDEALKECYRFINIRLRRLPGGRTKGNWVRNLVGMVMTSAGIGNEQSFTPVAVPSDFRAQRGRPRLNPGDKEEAAGAKAA